MSERKHKQQARWLPLEPFVAKVRDHRILYDLRHPNYRNVGKKDEVWETIGLELRNIGMNITGQELKKLWQGGGGIRDRYQREKMRSKRMVKGDSGSGEHYKSNWPLFNACRFLDGYGPESRKIPPVSYSDYVVSEAPEASLAIIDTTAHSPEPQPAPVLSRKRRRIVDHEPCRHPTDERLTEVPAKASREADDEIELFGRMMAAKLRRMAPKDSEQMQLRIMRLFAGPANGAEAAADWQGCEPEFLSVAAGTDDIKCEV